ncbi:ATP-binding cassette domain-containing protein [Enterococcus hulanensis]|uniref:ABC transporter ATP-binding protein n=1 Tax=Enterococcus hulanensis TaxID=2559929 RepID=UPI00289045D1|nr:oligopeptide/dipeptide ABC transporter ATP-binding protein [Enterococcus hulanensis]MDT2658800.1 ATP-binding cassette domain-containing protein [Enterococcus hulanensis]
MENNLLEIRNLQKSFPMRGKNTALFGQREQMLAVANLTFNIKEGETYGLVGESGCGKSTTGRMIVGLEEPNGGSIIYEGKDLCKLNDREFFPLRKDLQMVFQNTLSALNPRQRVGSILEDILGIHGVSNALERRDQVLEVLEKVGLSEYHYFRYPHELSGGQVQRLGIASALVIKPRLIICDEPVSALDVSIQAQVLNTLMDLQRDLSLSLLFISHDIGVIRYISDRIGVMYLGTLVEEATTDEVFKNPLHPYTKDLFSSVPDPYIRREKKSDVEFNGEQPVRTSDLKGCAFCARCPYAMKKCAEQTPDLNAISSYHRVACHLYDNVE